MLCCLALAALLSRAAVRAEGAGNWRPGRVPKALGLAGDLDSQGEAGQRKKRWRMLTVLERV